MAERVFQIEGKVLYQGGAPAAGVVLAVVDEDLVNDDLIGVGVTGLDGSFRLSFTTISFNQEAFEHESTPDIYVVCSVKRPAGLVAVHRQDFPGLTFAGGSEQLGAIELPFRAGDPVKALAGQVAMPGYTKVVQRLRLDDEVLAGVAAEMAALVGGVTGWKDLLAGVSVRLTDSVGEAFVKVLEQAGRVPDREQLATSLGATFGLDGLLALYDPFGKAILVDRRAASRQNLDGLRVILGHELVHAGQFGRHPELVEEQRLLLREMVEAMDGKPGTMSAAEYHRRLFGLMANIEGHATHIEQDFLRTIYSCADVLPHLSFVEALRMGFIKGKDSVREERKAKAAGEAAQATEQAAEAAEEEFEGDDSKKRQYAVGLSAYRKLARGGQPAPFDPALRPLKAPPLLLALAEQAEAGQPVGFYGLALVHLAGEEVERSPAKAIALLESAASAGHAAALVDLGLLLARGVDLPQDQGRALAFFRRAAEQGDARGQFLLGLSLANGEGVTRDLAEGIRWMLRAAEQGNARAQTSLGLVFLGGEGVPKDEARGLAWLRQGAEQGDPQAQSQLGQCYLYGTGLPKDEAEALRFLQAAADQGYANAISNLGFAYLDGLGVAKDEARAVALLRQAAERGVVRAQARLATLPPAS